MHTLFQPLDHQLFQDSGIVTASETFKENASFDAEALYDHAADDIEGFWNKQADCLDWFEKWDSVLDWQKPYAKWFCNGKLNACYNAVDRHISSQTRNKAAIIWEGENGDSKTVTYWDLYRQVNKCANVLKTLGVHKGDTVAIYLPMIPEAIIAMLACARIGAVHTVVFAGFSAEALKERIIDAGAELVITADGSFRRGNTLHLKEAVDSAVKECPTISHVLVVKHTGCAVAMNETRDYWYHSLMHIAGLECPPAVMDAEDPLFILYTSGTTGKPKGIIHTTGGYMVAATLTTAWVFDIKRTDVYWCTADVGWITGHTYVVYGPLSNAVTQVIYEGAHDWPKRDRCWQLIEKYGVTILYTAPTLIRTFMKWGESYLDGYDLSSLRLLGSVGEPINPEAWNWYYTHVGGKRCPIADTWWQTETGSIMIAPLAATTSMKPGSATKPLPGICAKVLTEEGAKTSNGLLAITAPWPSMLRGIHNDPERYVSTYWNKWDGKYYNTCDAAMQDEDGYFWLMGRVDDVMNISGHRIGTMEVESAFVDHPSVAESAVIAIAHPIKGEAIVAFVSLKESQQADEALQQTLKQHIVNKIGAIARPERIIFTKELPKTRSGKIMRRLLRDIAIGNVVGDFTTLADSSVLAQLKEKYDTE